MQEANVTARHRPSRVARRPPICAAIKQAREDAELTQEDVAARLRVTQSMVGRWEKGSEPMLDVIARLEAIFGLRKGDLLRAAGYVADSMSVVQAVEFSTLDPKSRRVLLATYRSLANGSR